MVRIAGTVFAAVLLLAPGTRAIAQNSPGPAKAALLSFVVPGLGQRYVNDARWRGSASFYLISESLYLAGMITSEWHRGQSVQSYRTWAASRAGAQIDGKDRLFFVTIGQHDSSDEFRNEQLRSRRWDQLNYVSSPDYHWAWRSRADLQVYRDLRTDADQWSQRRSLFIAVMVGNRVLSAVQALRAARRKQAARVALDFAPGYDGSATIRLIATL